MSEKIHQRFLAISEAISDELYQALKQVGVVKLSSREYIAGRKASLPEMLYRSVIGQQISSKAADSIWQRLLDQAGNTPLIDYIHGNNGETLRACGASGAKAKTLMAITQAFKSKQLETEHLKTLNRKERSNALTSLWGIGPWTADMASLFYFLDPDIWPEKDIAAVNTLQGLIGDGKNANEIATLFTPHRSYLALKMWRISDGYSKDI